MVFLTASGVSTCNTPSALRLTVVVLRIQPSVETAPPAVKGASQLPSFPPAAGSQLDVHHLLKYVFASDFSYLFDRWLGLHTHRHQHCRILNGICLRSWLTVFCCWLCEIINCTRDSAKGWVVSNMSLTLSELVIFLSAAKINMSSSSIIPEEFEPPPVFLASLKLASTFDLATNFRLFHFFLISSIARLFPYTEFTLVAMSFHSCFFFLLMSALFPDPLDISPAESISLMNVHSSSFVQLSFPDFSIFFFLFVYI